MKSGCKGFKKLLEVLMLFLVVQACYADIVSSDRSRAVLKHWSPLLEERLNDKKMHLGSEMFIRIFKQESELEIWIRSSNKVYNLYKTFPICTFSGDLGPKLKQGDRQSPEGFYFVNAGRLNPWSRFHLSFNLGYPNVYDRHHGYTGSALMVHGDCVSIGCYAMTDKGIEEIYTLLHKSLETGQPFVRVHVFPFRMTAENMMSRKKSRWYSFWSNLKEGYDWFENTGEPPNVEVSDGRYVFD